MKPPKGWKEDKTDPKIWYPTKKTLRENEELLNKMGAAHGIKVPLWAQWSKSKHVQIFHKKLVPDGDGVRFIDVIHTIPIDKTIFNVRLFGKRWKLIRTEYI